MEVFRRLTNPTLKKLYRFVLKRLVGRFLDDDITLEQLDVQLGSGRIELTDISINARALEEILPHLSFRLARVHVGKLRVEISYAKLLTESLAFFLDDVSIDIAPHPTSNDKGPTDVEDAVGVPDQITEGRPKTVDTSKRRSSVDNQAARHTSVSGGDITDSVSSSGTPTGDVAEGLDFLAQWIEQITSKVKVVVSGVTVRVSAEVQVNNDVERGSLANDSFLQIQCSSLKWCDETPETSALLTEGPRQPHSVVSGGGRTKSGQHVGGPLLAHKRLTIGTISADWCKDGRKSKRSVVRISGPTGVLIKQDRR
ncbi:unnamed protein product, partial [Sphacelaria rigidula]